MALGDSQMTRHEITRALLTAYGLLIGTVSTLFMTYVFFVETAEGHGVRFYEPNFYIAAGEYLATVAALGVMVSLLLRAFMYPERA